MSHPSFEPVQYSSEPPSSRAAARRRTGAELLQHLESSSAWDTERTEELVCEVVDAIFDQEATQEWTAAALRTLIARVPLKDGESRVMRDARTAQMVAWCIERYRERRSS